MIARQKSCGKNVKQTLIKGTTLKVDFERRPMTMATTTGLQLLTRKVRISLPHLRPMKLCIRLDEADGIDAKNVNKLQLCAAIEFCIARRAD